MYPFLFFSQKAAHCCVTNDKQYTLPSLWVEIGNSLTHTSRALINPHPSLRVSLNQVVVVIVVVVVVVVVLVVVAVLILVTVVVVALEVAVVVCVNVGGVGGGSLGGGGGGAKGCT